MSVQSVEENPPQITQRPLVIDLEGTLIKSDLLIESFFLLLATSPWQAFKALFKKHAAVKTAIVPQAALDYTTLPLNEELLTWLKQEKDKGRQIYPLSALHEDHARALVEHLGLFAEPGWPHDLKNLAGKSKADALSHIFGTGGFDYLGAKEVDLPVWEQAGNVILVNGTSAFRHKIQKRFPDATLFAAQLPRWKDCEKTLRIHQWIKNLLVFVPGFTAHHFSFSSLIVCLLAFFSFSFCASSVYILNDLLDLRHDRAHHSKRHRPFAAGRIDLRHGLLLMLLAFAASLGISAFLPLNFFFALTAYYGLTLAYSIGLKRHMMVDVVTLALLYCSRLVAGATAVTVPFSPWLISFSVFLFLSLALVKRCSELIARQTQGTGDPGGRGYRLTDLPILESMAAASGYVAALTSGLYISSPTVAQLYACPEGLWAIPVILLFWISRILVLTHRGDMHDDPVFFAAHDRPSLICGGLMILVVLMSI